MSLEATLIHIIVKGYLENLHILAIDNNEMRLLNLS